MDAKDVSAVIPSEKSKQLINFMQLGDVQTSLSMIYSLINTAPHDSPIKYRIFLFDLIGTLIRAVETGDKNDSCVRLSDSLCDLTAISDVSQITDRITNIVTEFCKLRSENILESEEKELEENLYKRDIVAESIQENFTNQSLNIAMIGEYFNITPYYVSNIFKKSENISMLDYISITCIEKAKNLLETTDLNLETIALQCGFSNIRTFMRVFQKFEIVTPGKYKELNHK